MEATRPLMILQKIQAAIIVIVRAFRKGNEWMSMRVYSQVMGKPD